MPRIKDVETKTKREMGLRSKKRNRAQKVRSDRRHRGGKDVTRVIKQVGEERR